MNKKTNTIFGLATAVLAIVAIFVLFSTAFGNEWGDPSSRGNVFQIAFGTGETNRNPVPALIAAFSLLIAGTVTSLITALLKGKGAMIGFVLTLILLGVAGTLFVLGPGFYISSNYVNADLQDQITLGTGLICAVIFSYAGALLSLYGAYSSFKN